METISETIDKRLRTGDILFSICSLVLSFFLFLIICFNKNLRSLTYDFLWFVFLSEIFNSIGNILEFADISLASTLLIPLSDIFTMILFCFFMHCSCEQLIKSNKDIKNKKKIFIPISAGIALIYGIVFFVVFKTNGQENKHFYFYNDFVGEEIPSGKKNFKFMCYIHVGILFLMSIFICYKTIILLRFLKEKQNSDSANSWKIAILVKTIFRFPIICILYWLIYIIYTFINLINGDFKIKYLLKLFAKAFLCLRGFLFSINTIQTNKIQILIEKIWEVHIKHNLILKLNFCPKRGSKNK